jgi:hypothetical protein
VLLKIYIYGYLNLFSQSIIAIDGSKFKAVNNRDRNRPLIPQVILTTLSFRRI